MAEPLDIEALAKRAGHILFTVGPEQPAATAREVCVLLDQLAAEVRAAQEKAWDEGAEEQSDYEWLAERGRNVAEPTNPYREKGTA